jgi:hypothetical protein
MSVAISPEDCAPYLSITLLRIEKNPASNLSELHEAIVARLKDNSEARKPAPVQRRIHKTKRSAFKQGARNVAWIHYSEIRPPPWYRGKDLKEERHHVVFLVQKDGLVALVFSDPTFRTSIVADIRKALTAPLGALKF